MKKYFNRSTFWLSFALILYVLSELYYNQFEDIIVTGTWSMNLTETLWWLSQCACYGLVTAAIIQFILFMRDSNKGLLFTAVSSKRFVRISTLLVASGVLHFSYIRFGPGGSSLVFALCMFFSSLSYSFSTIFKEATLIDEEHKLTI
jgi:hypothetical protein